MGIEAEIWVSRGNGSRNSELRPFEKRYRFSLLLTRDRSIVSDKLSSLAKCELLAEITLRIATTTFLLFILLLSSFRNLPLSPYHQQNPTQPT